jgi:hypothetical protein
MTAPARKTRQRPAPGQREASPSRHAGNTNSPETALIAPSPIEVLAAQFAEMQADMRQMRARVDAMTHRRWRWRPLARERGWQAA